MSALPETSDRSASNWKVARVVILLCILAAVFWLFRMNATGVSWNGKPSAAFGRKVLERRIEQQGKGAVRLMAFNKIDGSYGEVFGQKLYQMQFEARITFLQDGSWVKGSSPRNPRFELSPRHVGRSEIANLFASIEGAVNVYSLQNEQVKGELLFHKTEQGWSSEEGIKY